MNKKTFELKEKILQFEDISDRLKVMRDWYKGETCYIVSAGPSLKDIKINYLKSKPERSSYGKSKRKSS